MNATDRICDNRLMYKPVPYYYFGMCYSLEFPKCVTEKGVLEVGLKFK